MEPLRPADPRQVGPYRLDGRLGAGGMGEVFRGVSPSGRTVAVKIVRAEYAADPEFRRRFAREIEAARRVGGFHTAQVVDADPAAASPWLVTAYIPGPSLRQVVLRQGPMAPGAVRRLGAGLAEGLAAIHACGLVHRDLKPGNVIMGPDGPRIIDFGIARAADATALTSTGAVVGTFSFMSPEQVRADVTGPASDVFSLGCVLAYAALGHGPFDAPTIPAIVRRIVSAPPDLGGLTDPGLRDVIGRCLEKDPRRRPSVPDVLTGLTTGVPRRVPRRAVLFGGAGAAATAVAVPAVLLWPRSGGPKAPRTPHTVPSVLTLPSTEVAVFDVAFTPDGRTLVGAGFSSLLRWDLATARVSARELKDDTTYKQPMAFSPDGRTLATGGDDGAVHLRDTGTGRIRKKLTVAGGANALAFAPDGRTLAVASNRDRPYVQVLNMVTGRAVTMKTDTPPSALAFSPDGERLGGRFSSGKLMVWNPSDGAKTAEASTEGGNYDCLAFSPDGKTVAMSNSYNWGIELRSASDGDLRATLKDVKESVRALAFSPDGGTLVSLDKKDARLWNVASRRVTATFPGDDDDAQAVVFSPDGQSFATTSGAGTTRFYRF
ncbi:Serine/threonine-protein kinase AfsK [Actinomadura rubteroloni]|uniref:Serine/threonine-protein kinase AfsK n=1 Tax=Actinomadura rubteroloni TaxID=1926885 RepID=A0A2P4UMB6_9ACTN|nr:serine/threonine-protein kinase [Actinomadura rubteroloni]POM26193.1 Serine/threonine-protein kinase AfsK [Actinomadura rubteroloni]